jgi:hypothetical protein
MRKHEEDENPASHDNRSLTPTPADEPGHRDADGTRMKTSEGPATSKEVSRFPGSLKLWSTG